MQNQGNPCGVCVCEAWISCWGAWKSLNFLKNVLIWQREENNLSVVALVMGNVRYADSCFSTYRNICLMISLLLNASRMVLRFVTFIMWFAEQENTAREHLATSAAGCPNKLRQFYFWILLWNLGVLASPILKKHLVPNANGISTFRLSFH